MQLFIRSRLTTVGMHAASDELEVGVGHDAALAGLDDVSPSSKHRLQFDDLVPQRGVLSLQACHLASGLRCRLGGLALARKLVLEPGNLALKFGHAGIRGFGNRGLVTKLALAVTALFFGGGCCPPRHTPAAHRWFWD